jgi:hypothetical protein
MWAKAYGGRIRHWWENSKNSKFGTPKALCDRYFSFNGNKGTELDKKCAKCEKLLGK